MDAQIACDRFLEKGTQVQFKLFEVAVTKTLEILEQHKALLKDDPKRDNYKLHTLVPLQTYYMQKSNESSTPVKRKKTTS